MSDSHFRLIYRSHSCIEPGTRKSELGTLFSGARSNNKKQNVTGALLLSGDLFVQTLEGDEATVRALFEHIATDPRHDDVTLLEAETVDEPAFPRWSMAQVSEVAEKPDTYLIAHADGISPAASRGSSAAQESVLDRMRSAARGGAPVS